MRNNYYRQDPPGRFRGPRGQLWVWIAFAVASLLMAMAGTGFRPVITYWVMSFVSSFCNMLTVTVIISAVMSWFPINPYARIPALIRDTVAPLLDPLRRVIPLVGSIDLSSLAALVLLNLIPFLVKTIVLRLF